MKTARLTAAMACVVALTVSACGGSAQSGLDRTAHQKLTDGKTFTYAISSDPGTLDPAITVLSIARGVDQFLYDGLINLDTKGQPQAAIAEKWEASTTTASFTLRKGITCADGSPLTAKDVAGSINFVGDPANKSPIAGVTVKAGTKAVADEAAGTVKVTSGGRTRSCSAISSTCRSSARRGWPTARRWPRARTAPACSLCPRSSRTTTTR